METQTGQGHVRDADVVLGMDYVRCLAILELLSDSVDEACGDRLTIQVVKFVSQLLDCVSAIPLRKS